MEHHSNIVPWQMLCEQTGAALPRHHDERRRRVVSRRYEGLLNERTKLVAIVHVSNSRWHDQSDPEVIRPGATAAKSRGRRDRRRQAVPTARPTYAISIADFYAFSGHKLFAPTGIGDPVRQGCAARTDAALPGRRRYDQSVTFEKTHYNGPSPTSSRPAPRTSPAASGWASPSTDVNRIGLDRHRRVRAPTSRICRPMPHGIDGLDRRHRQEKVGRAVVLARGCPHEFLRHRHRARPSKASPFAPAITAASR